MKLTDFGKEVYSYIMENGPESGHSALELNLLDSIKRGASSRSVIQRASSYTNYYGKKNHPKVQQISDAIVDLEREGLVEYDEDDFGGRSYEIGLES
jgi:hypothetical protein